MKKRKIFMAKVAKAIVLHTLKRDANCTTCLVVYQPKAPKGLTLLKKNKNVF